MLRWVQGEGRNAVKKKTACVLHKCLVIENSNVMGEELMPPPPSNHSCYIPEIPDLQLLSTIIQKQPLKNSRKKNSAAFKT